LMCSLHIFKRFDDLWILCGIIKLFIAPWGLYGFCWLALGCEIFYRYGRRINIGRFICAFASNKREY